MKQGDVIAGRYRLLRPVGEGATGTVWAARHELLGRDFALKIARAGQRPTKDARAMFLREVQIVGRLRHPNVVDIADAGELGDGLYLAMELLQGESLAQRIARGPIPPTEALAVAAAVCRGLAAAHEAGVVHRDIKPENIYLARGSAGGVVPKLLDFGVSSARGVATLDPGKIFATPAYMSPERALGESCDARTDVWAMGVVLYEMLTGHLPFTAASYTALLPKIIDAPYQPLPDSVPPEVRTVVAGCLAKDRADRYAGAEALLEAIERARAALPAPDPGATNSGLFVETGPDVTSPSSRTPAGFAASRGPRRGLALAILAVPVAIGIAAATVGTRGKTTPVPPVGAAPASPPVPAPTADDTAPTPAATATATPTAVEAAAPTTTAAAKAAPVTSARVPAAAPLGPKPRPHGTVRPVTNVNNAGF